MEDFNGNQITVFYNEACEEWELLAHFMVDGEWQSTLLDVFQDKYQSIHEAKQLAFHAGQLPDEYATLRIDKLKIIGAGGKLLRSYNLIRGSELESQTVH